MRAPLYGAAQVDPRPGEWLTGLVAAVPIRQLARHDGVGADGKHGTGRHKDRAMGWYR
jgi:hypothetical protein